MLQNVKLSHVEKVVVAADKAAKVVVNECDSEVC